MTAKEFLSQAYRLDERIKSKRDQIQNLNDLATSCTSVMTGMPKAHGNTTSRMADAVCKIADLQNVITTDMDELIHLKAEMVNAITAVDSIEHQVILEKRYLCYQSWEQIAVDLGYSVRHLHRMHDEALEKVTVPKRCHEMSL